VLTLLLEGYDTALKVVVLISRVSDFNFKVDLVVVEVLVLLAKLLKLIFVFSVLFLDSGDEALLLLKLSGKLLLLGSSLLGLSFNGRIFFLEGTNSELKFFNLFPL